MIKINTSGDYVQLIYVDPVQESVQQELKSDTDAFECSYDSDGKLYMQFGLMRFENPDPTDFTINGSAVTDAADFISKLNALFTGGGGGGGWGTTGTIATLTGDSTVELNGQDLSFTNGSDLWWYLDLDTKENALRTFGANNHNAQLHIASDDITGVNVLISAQDGLTGNEVRFNGDAVAQTIDIMSGNGDTTFTKINLDNSVQNITYTADTHTFIGINEFVDDAAAAAGGVPVNGLYHSMGTVKIRLS